MGPLAGMLRCVVAYNSDPVVRALCACICVCRCCGVSQNTYHTLKDMRVVFVDGTVLDTADPKSCESFLQVSVCACPRAHVCVCVPLSSRAPSCSQPEVAQEPHRAQDESAR